MHNMFHQALEQAKINGLIMQNPADNAIIPKSPKKEMRVLSVEEQMRLLSVIHMHRLGFAIKFDLATGLRIGEACALCWQDIDLDKQCLTVRRSIRYNGKRHKTEIGTTKRKKIRTVDFCDTLAQILRSARNEQNRNRLKYGQLYSLNYYKEVKEKNRTYYEVYSSQRSEDVPPEYKEISLVCLRPDGSYESPSAVSSILRAARKRMPELGDLHFHLFRHTFTTNLLSYGAAPKDVQELLGHSDVGTTMNIYAHSTKEAKRNSARLLDKVAGGA